MSIISTHALSKHYSGLRAVSNVDFNLPEGQVRALIGPNGAGKTTFVGMLSGRIKSTSGSVTFLDADVTHMPCLLYTSPSPRDRTRSRMPSSA